MVSAFYFGLSVGGIASTIVLSISASNGMPYFVGSAWTIVGVSLGVLVIEWIRLINGE